MFLANLYLKSRPNPIQFFFTSHTSALEAGAAKDDVPLFSIIDDYGQTGRFQRDDVCGYLIVNFEQAIAAEIEKSMLTERVKARFFGVPQQGSNPALDA